MSHLRKKIQHDGFFFFEKKTPVSVFIFFVISVETKKFQGGKDKIRKTNIFFLKILKIKRDSHNWSF